MTLAAGNSLTGRQPKAIQSALKVLEEVARSGPGVTAKEVSDALRIPPATTYRLLNLLVGEGYLVRLPNLSGFALGKKIGVFVDAVVTPVVCPAAREVLSELRMQVRFGVNLAFYVGNTIRYADTDPDYPPGEEKLLSHCLSGSALGKLLLAEGSELQGLLPDRGIERATRRTIVSRTELTEHLRQVRSQGYATQVGELREDGACLAMPIRAANGQLVAGLAIATSLDRAELLERHTSLLESFASRLAPLLARAG
ncbi:MAG: IclR family transcriptional regulator [Mycobacteriaceae bacterium]